MTRDLALLVLRLAGFFLAFGHGWGKVSMLAAGQGERLVQVVGALGFPAPGFFAWAAALAEFAGGLCVGLGLFTRVAAGFSAFTMLVAAIGQHHAWAQLMARLGLIQVSADTLKGWGNPELALAYLVILLGVALAGPGSLALDSLIGRKR